MGAARRRSARSRTVPAARPVFDKLGEDMATASSKWRQWFDDEEPERLPAPGESGRVLVASPVHLLLLLRALRPDRLTAALRIFVTAKLGAEYISPPPFNMSATYDESSVATPIFFVLFPGVDPTSMVEALGKTKVGGNSNTSMVKAVGGR